MVRNGCVSVSQVNDNSVKIKFNWRTKLTQHVGNVCFLLIKLSSNSIIWRRLRVPARIFVTLSFTARSTRWKVIRSGWWTQSISFLAQVTRAKSSSLWFFRARVIWAQTPPLFAIEFLSYAVRCGHNIAFLEAMWSRCLRSETRK